MAEIKTKRKDDRPKLPCNKCGDVYRSKYALKHHVRHCTGPKDTSE